MAKRALVSFGAFRFAVGLYAAGTCSPLSTLTAPRAVMRRTSASEAAPTASGPLSASWRAATAAWRATGSASLASRDRSAFAASIAP